MKSLNGTEFERLVIMLKEPSNEEHYEKVIEEFKGVFTDGQNNAIGFRNYYDTAETTT